jgi:hypothetical protein
VTPELTPLPQATPNSLATARWPEPWSSLLCLRTASAFSRESSSSQAASPVAVPPPPLLQSRLLLMTSIIRVIIATATAVVLASKPRCQTR